MAPGPSIEHSTMRTPDRGPIRSWSAIRCTLLVKDLTVRQILGPVAAAPPP